MADLLRSAHGLRILVTSREWLRIDGEREFGVQPLDSESGDPALPRPCAARPPRRRGGRGRRRRGPGHRRPSRGAPPRDRARGGADPDVPAIGHPRAPDDEPRPPRGRSARPARAPADAPRRDLVEPRPAVRRRADDLPAKLGVRRRLGCRPRPGGDRPGRWPRHARRGRPRVTVRQEFRADRPDRTWRAAVPAPHPALGVRPRSARPGGRTRRVRAPARHGLRRAERSRRAAAHRARIRRCGSTV